MASQTTANSTLLIRQELWSAQLKEILRDQLDAQRWVDWITEFPDGETLTIPSVGDAITQDITENQAVRYDPLDTGEWQFVIDQYVGSAHYITKKALQDSFYGQQVQASFVPKESRAILEKLETDILKTPGPDADQSGTSQTTADANVVNNYDHRYPATGTSNVMAVEDFAYAKLSLKKANVPLTQLVAIVDPNVAYTLETTANITNISNNPQWEGIIETGLTSNMRFIRNVYGFDVYESNYLNNTGNETVANSVHHTADTTVTSGIENLLFSAEPSVLPIKGLMRQLPEVDAEYNKDFQREEYVTTARWGTKLYRPENMIIILTASAAL
jgi:hypothetical protein|tara:strand:- start:2083 stop:3072 length:990 start_codon:yes stop_codon:yes gene_type:complete